MEQGNINRGPEIYPRDSLQALEYISIVELILNGENEVVKIAHKINVELSYDYATSVLDFALEKLEYTPNAQIPRARAYELFGDLILKEKDNDDNETIIHAQHNYANALEELESCDLNQASDAIIRIHQKRARLYTHQHKVNRQTTRRAMTSA